MRIEMRNFTEELSPLPLDVDDLREGRTLAQESKTAAFRTELEEKKAREVTTAAVQEREADFYVHARSSTIQSSSIHEGGTTTVNTASRAAKASRA